MTFPLPMPPALSSSAYVNNVSGLARSLEQFSGVTPMAQHVAPAKQQQQQQNQQQSMYPPQPRYSKRDLDPVAMARILEQFPGTARAYSQVDPSLHNAPNGRFVNMPPMRISEAGIGGGGGGGGGGYGPSFGEGRLTNMSLASMFSIQSLRRLLESARNDHYRQAADRDTIESTLSAEIRDLIQLSAPQLEQVDNLPMEDTETHVGRDVDSFYGEMEDRVSELRFTDLSRWSAVGEAEYKPRLTDSSEHTNFSKTSSMDASMRSSTTEESVRSSPDCKRSKYNTHRHSGGDIASAELLLRLSASDASPSSRMGGREGSLGKDACCPSIPSVGYWSLSIMINFDRWIEASSARFIRFSAPQLELVGNLAMDGRTLLLLSFASLSTTNESQRLSPWRRQLILPWTWAHW